MLPKRRTSHLEFSSQLNEKNIVVLEIGRRYTRCGLAGEPSPRAIIKSAVHQSNDELLYLHEIQDSAILESNLGTFMETIYFNHLAVTPKEKKVVIVESVFCKSSFKNALTKVLFDQFNVPSLMFVPDHLMALSTLGLTSGLILDLGSEEAISIAVIERVTLLNGAQISSLAAKSLDDRIKSVLIKNNEHLSDFLTDETVEDIRVKSCFVAPYERAIEITQKRFKEHHSKHEETLKTIEDDNIEKSLEEISRDYLLCDPDDGSPTSIQFCLGGNRMIIIPGNLREGACEMLFEIYGHEHSLVTMLMETILMAPIDCRKLLCENIVVIGGLANLPGLEHRLAKELKSLELKTRFQSKTPDIFRFHKLVCPKNYVCWLGASMFCSTSFFEMKSTNRADWIKGGKKNLLDWSDLIWRDKYAPKSNSND